MMQIYNAWLTTSLLLTQCQYIDVSHLYKSHNKDIQCVQFLISHLPFKTGAPSLSVIKIQWRPSTLKLIRKISVIQNYISMFHSECTSFEAWKLKVKVKPLKNFQPQVPWQSPLIFLINVGKVMENVLFWCYTA